jgi:hypothetical protein
MSELVNWYYCQQCEKDVEAELEADINIIGDTRLVIVEVQAICCECGAMLAAGESESFTVG